MKRSLSALCIVFVIVAFSVASVSYAQTSDAASPGFFRRVTLFFENIGEQFKAAREIVTILVTKVSVSPIANTSLLSPEDIRRSIEGGSSNGDSVLRRNQPPSLAPIASKTVEPGTLVRFTLFATDSDGDALVYTVNPLPQGAAFDEITGEFRWVPALSQSGTTYRMTAVALDDRGAEDTRVVTIAVTGESHRINTENEAPVLEEISDYTISPGDALVIESIASDPNGDALTYSITGAGGALPKSAVVNKKTGTFSWTPTNADIGKTLRLVFRVSDGKLSTTQTVTVTVEASGAIDTTADATTADTATENHAPKLDPVGDETVAVGETLDVEFSAYDPDDDALTFFLVRNTDDALPKRALFSRSANEFTWTPTAAQAGTYTFTVKVTDGKLYDTRTMKVTVTEVPNTAPILDPVGAQALTAGQEFVLYLSAVDAEGDSLTYGIDFQPSHTLPSGAVFDSVNGVLTWTPIDAQVGSLTATVSVTDGKSMDNETVPFTITRIPASNLPPKIADITNTTVPAGNLIQFTVSTEDPEHGVVTVAFKQSTQPPAGATISSGNTFSWTPTLGQAGLHVITIVASDGTNSTEKSFTVTVTSPMPTNTPPVFVAIGSKSVSENTSLVFTVSSTDANNDPLTYGVISVPTGAVFTPSTRTFAWTPTYAQAGNYAVTFTVSDGIATVSTSSSITVLNVNRPPTLSTIGNKSVQVNQLLTFPISGSDPDNDQLTYARVTYSGIELPGASFNPTTRQFSWRPTITGSYMTRFEVRDTGGLVAGETIQINVSAEPLVSDILNIIGKTLNAITEVLQSFLP